MRSSDESGSTSAENDDSRRGAVGYFVAAPAESSSAQIGLREVIGALRRRIILTSALALLGLACGSLVLVFATPIYRVETLLLPVSRDAPQGLGSSLGQFGGLAQLAGVNLGQPDNTWVSYSTLESRAFIEDFIVDFNLLPVLFWRDWNAEDGTWDIEDEEDIPTLWDAYEFFIDDVLRLDWNATTQLLTLTIEWRDPDVAAVWANEMVGRVNRSLATRAISESEKSVDYLNRELEKTSILGLRQAIYNLIESEISTVMTANVHEEYAFRVIDPAAPPDSDEYVWPQPVLIILAGLILGIGAALTIVLVGLYWNAAPNGAKSDSD